MTSPDDDPRLDEKVTALAGAILDYWPDDHPYPLVAPIPGAPLRSLNGVLEELAQQMAEFLLYHWEDGRK